MLIEALLLLAPVCPDAQVLPFPRTRSVRIRSTSRPAIIVSAYGREHPAVCRLLLLEARVLLALKRAAAARERLDFAEALAARYLSSAHPVRAELQRVRSGT